MQNPESPTPAQSAPAPGTPSQPAPPAPVSVITEEGGRQIVVQVPGPGAAMTEEQVRALNFRIDELGDQLRSVQSRRHEVAASLHGADPAARPGIEQRLRVLDERIVQIESDLGATSRELASVPAALVSAARAPIHQAGNDEEEMFFGGTLLGASLVVAMMWARRWRRRRRGTAGAIPAASTDQFHRLEQAVDAIAIEVERIAEGQRFTAKLMADSHERARREAVPRESGSAV